MVLGVAEQSRRSSRRPQLLEHLIQRVVDPCVRINLLRSDNLATNSRLSRHVQRLRHVAVSQFVSLGVVRRFHADELTELVRGDNLVTSKLVSHFSKIAHRDKLERVTEELDRLSLSASGLGEELPLDLASNCRKNRLD